VESGRDCNVIPLGSTAVGIMGEIVIIYLKIGEVLVTG
jgi:hypothetical protein